MRKETVSEERIPLFLRKTNFKQQTNFLLKNLISQLLEEMLQSSIQ